MLNKVILQGRLTKAPRENGRITQSGTSTVRFAIAVERNFKDKQAGKYETDFIDCMAWGTTSDFIQRYFEKGSLIIVEGELRNNNYINSQGVKHYGNVVNVTAVYFGESKKSQANTQNSPQGAADAPQVEFSKTQAVSRQNIQAAEQFINDVKEKPEAKEHKLDIDLGDLTEYQDIISDGNVPF